MVIDKIVQTEKQTQARLASIESTVNKLYGVEVARAKEEKQASRRAEKLARIRAGDRKPASPASILRKEKKEKKGLLNTLMELVPAALMAGPVIKAVGVMAVTGLVAALRNPDVREALKKAFVDTLTAAWNAVKSAGHFVINLAGDSARGHTRNEGLDSAIQQEYGSDDKKRLEAIRKARAIKQDYEEKYYKAEYLRLKAEANGHKDIAERQKKYAQEHLAVINEKIELLKDEKDFAESKGVSLGDIDFNIRHHRDVKYGLFGRPNNAAEFHHLLDQAHPRQKGGPLRVPGTGSGDKMFSVVPNGSFVMNRNAAGFQTGGVPVLLEPGEDVYMPGQWGPMHAMMNKLVPRFQEGGNVGDGKKKEDSSKVQGTSQNFGLVNPTPNTSIAANKGGYAADTGLDIHGNIGDPIVAPASGTLEYLEKGHTAQMGQDSDPIKPGYQPQHSFRIKLDKPFTYNGKRVNFAYGTHLNSMNPELANTSGKKVKAGQLLGGLGQANGVPHLHLGLVGDRSQSEFLNFKEVKSVLMGAKTTGVTGDTRQLSSSTSDGEKTTSQLQSEQNWFENMIGGGVKNVAGAMGLPGLADLLGIFYTEGKRALGGLFGAIFGGIGNLMGGKAKAGDDGLTPKESADQDNAANITPAAVSGDSKDKRILDLIASVEANKQNPYGGFNYGAGMGDTDATKKTISWLSKNSGGAIGRYQHMPQYLMQRATDAGFSGDTLFTPEVQDALTLSQLKRETSYSSWRNGTVSNKAMGNELSRIWRGLPHSSGGTFPDEYAGHNAAGMSHRDFMSQMEAASKLQRGGVAQMRGASSSSLNRFDDAQTKFAEMIAEASSPIVIPVPVGGGGGGAPEPVVASGAPGPPDLPDGPQVVALLELTNRLAMGAAI